MQDAPQPPKSLPLSSSKRPGDGSLRPASPYEVGDDGFDDRSHVLGPCLQMRWLAHPPYSYADDFEDSPRDQVFERIHAADNLQCHNAPVARITQDLPSSSHPSDGFKELSVEEGVRHVNVTETLQDQNGMGENANSKSCRRKSKKQREKRKQKEAKRTCAVASAAAVGVAFVVAVGVAFVAAVAFSTPAIPIGSDNSRSSTAFQKAWMPSGNCFANTSHTCATQELATECRATVNILPESIVELEIQQQRRSDSRPKEHEPFNAFCTSFQKHDERARNALLANTNYTQRTNATAYCESKRREGNFFSDLCCKASRDDEGLKACYSIGRHGVQVKASPVSDRTTQRQYREEKANELKWLHYCQLHSEGELLLLIRTESSLQDKAWAEKVLQLLILPFLKLATEQSCPITLSTDELMQNNSQLPLKSQQASAVVFMDWNAELARVELNDAACQKHFQRIEL